MDPDDGASNVAEAMPGQAAGPVDSGVFETKEDEEELTAAASGEPSIS